MRFRKITKSLSLALLLVLPLAGFATADALAGGYQANLNHFASASRDQACAGLDALDSSQGCASSSTTIPDTISSVVTILSVVAGVVAIIMVILSGFRYITSGGEAGKVSGAKNALIYALVGIAIAVMAQFLVHFVINNTSSATTLCKDGNAAHAKLAANDPACK